MSYAGDLKTLSVLNLTALLQTHTKYEAAPNIDSAHQIGLDD